MKLNNHGWGLREMIVLTTILLIFLGIVVYLIIVIKQKKDPINIDKIPIVNEVTTKKTSISSDEQRDYTVLEDQLKNGAMSIVSTSYQNNGTSEIYITAKRMLENSSISKIVDPKDSTPCSGYVRVLVDNNKNYKYSSFIKCSNYTTTNYDESHDER